MKNILHDLNINVLFVEDLFNKNIIKVNKDYTIDDFVLITNSNKLPKNRELKTPRNASNLNYYPNYYMEKAILDQYESSDTTFVSAVSKIYEKTFCLSEDTTSTVHFSLNQVPSKKEKYTIIEPLKYHIYNNTIDGLLLNDVYFKENVLLSNKAIIAMNKEEIKELLKTDDGRNDLRDYNIFIYEENKIDSINLLLQFLGYNVFSDIKFKNSDEFKKVNNYIKVLTSLFNFNTEEYRKSQVKKDDYNNHISKLKINSLNNLYNIIKHSNLTEEEKNYYHSKININTSNRSVIFYQLYKKLGYDNYVLLNENANNIFKEQKYNKKLTL